MSAKEVPPALAADALLGKSRVYIGRALVAKARQDTGEYQLWESLALELLGKSALAETPIPASSPIRRLPARYSPPQA